MMMMMMPLAGAGSLPCQCLSLPCRTVLTDDEVAGWLACGAASVNVERLSQSKELAAQQDPTDCTRWVAQFFLMVTRTNGATLDGFSLWNELLLLLYVYGVQLTPSVRLLWYVRAGAFHGILSTASPHVLLEFWFSQFCGLSMAA